jgi:hypothetical protein
MTVHNHSEPAVSAVPANGPEPDLAALCAECERLRERTRLLEEQHDHDQKAMAELEQYRRLLYTAVERMFTDREACFTEEEVRELLEGKDGLPREAFIAELEQFAKGL